MSNVKFKQWQCHDDRPALTQEDGIHRALSFSGIHNVEFTDWINDAFDVATSQISEVSLEDPEGTWYTNGGKLYGVGSGAARWYKVRHITATDISFTATFTKTGDRGAFLFNSDDSYDGYLVWWTGTAVGVTDVDGSTETLLTSVPCTETGTAEVTVSVRAMRYSSIDKVDDLAIGLWFDGKLLLNHTMEYKEKGEHVGFAVYQSDSITFDDLRVAQLHQIVEWASVDPGEEAAACLSRIIGQDKIRAQARYDGSVKVWRNTETTSDWTAPASRILTYTESRQVHPPFHLRMVGALHEVDVFRDGTQGHVFVIAQDPNALTQTATYNAATRKIKDLCEMAHTIGVVMAPNPVLEPEDVITYDGLKWRISTIKFAIAVEGGGAYVLSSTIEARRCLDA